MNSTKNLGTVQTYFGNFFGTHQDKFSTALRCGRLCNLYYSRSSVWRIRWGRITITSGMPKKQKTVVCQIGDDPWKREGDNHNRGIWVILFFVSQRFQLKVACVESEMSKKREGEREAWAMVVRSTWGASGIFARCYASFTDIATGLRAPQREYTAAWLMMQGPNQSRLYRLITRMLLTGKM